VIFAGLFWLTRQHGAMDPVCGMTVDRNRATRAEYAGHTYYSCSDHCRHAFEADPEQCVGKSSARAEAGVPTHAQ
jgi:YHS domain-containing protein